MASSNQGNQGNQGNQANQGTQGSPGSQSNQVGSKDKDAGKDSADTSNRGSAAMDPMKQRDSAHKGEKPAQGTSGAQELTAEEAREATRKAGQSGMGQSGTADKR